MHIKNFLPSQQTVRASFYAFNQSLIGAIQRVWDVSKFVLRVEKTTLFLGFVVVSIWLDYWVSFVEERAQSVTETAYEGVYRKIETMNTEASKVARLLQELSLRRKEEIPKEMQKEDFFAKFLQSFRENFKKIKGVSQKLWHVPTPFDSQLSTLLFSFFSFAQIHRNVQKKHLCR